MLSGGRGILLMLESTCTNTTSLRPHETIGRLTEVERTRPNDLGALSKFLSELLHLPTLSLRCLRHLPEDQRMWMWMFWGLICEEDGRDYIDSHENVKFGSHEAAIVVAKVPTVSP